jgi:nitrogen fixation-related uncharacterized protein
VSQFSICTDHALIYCNLALFAVGLLVYLWEINKQVAAPVFAIASMFVVLYAAATFLPVISESCPYGTALSDPFRTYMVPPIKWTLAILVGLIPASIVIFLVMLGVLLKWVKCTTLAAHARSVANMLGDEVGLMLEKLITKSRRNQKDEPGTDEVPMDIVTSRILVWLISNSETTLHVSVALQAISGASIALPVSPFRESGVDNLATSSLLGCFSRSWGDGNLRLKPTSNLELASSYFRALSYLLVTDSQGGHHKDYWHRGDYHGVGMNAESNFAVYRLYVPSGK